MWLERWACHVNASSGAAGFLRGNGPPHPSPDIVLVDYQLGAGEMDGISAALELRARLARSIPALVVSADTSDAASAAAATRVVAIVCYA